MHGCRAEGADAHSEHLPVLGQLRPKFSQHGTAGAMAPCPTTPDVLGMGSPRGKKSLPQGQQEQPPKAGGK